MGNVASIAAARARRSVHGADPAAVADDALVQAVQRGDGRVAQRLYHRLAPTVRRALRRLSASTPDDLEDLVQSSFERIVAGLRRGAFREGANLEAWASVIATRVGMDHLRRIYRSRRLFSSHGVPPTAAEPARAEHAAELSRVREVLCRLKPANAEVLFLHDALGCDLSEIAGHLDITTSAAQSRLVRTRKELLERLQKQEGCKR